MCPYKNVIWNRKIDLIENHKAKVVCKNGNVYTGYGAFPCVGEDENDEEVDAICFEIDDSGSVTLTENDIDHYEILDRNTKEMKCPCCRKSMVSEYDICEVCNWQNDPVQKIHPDLKGGANEMSLNEAIIAFRKEKEQNI